MPQKEEASEPRGYDRETVIVVEPRELDVGGEDLGVTRQAPVHRRGGFILQGEGNKYNGEPDPYLFFDHDDVGDGDGTDPAP